ncbi:MAG: hypothetical protein FWF50_06370 [Defluviitaleaceae bacterium]|nr:hypothetical protein [Defluviitaleaceae bacterium]
MNNYLKFILAAGAAALLTACGGSNEPQPTPEELMARAEELLAALPVANEELEEITEELEDENIEETSDAGFDPNFIPEFTPHFDRIELRLGYYEDEENSTWYLSNFSHLTLRRLGDTAIVDTNNKITALEEIEFIRLSDIAAFEDVEFITLENSDSEIFTSADMKLIRVPLWLSNPSREEESRQHVAAQYTTFFRSHNGYRELVSIQNAPLIENSVVYREQNLIHVPARTTEESVAYIPFTGIGNYYLMFRDVTGFNFPPISFIIPITESDIPTDWR